jgi:MYXO-CTERM domain-containing protein
MGGRGKGRGWSGGGGGFTLTRLHARYSKENLGADLVFKAAPPIVGGREFMGENGKLERGSRSDGYNNFQGRYAVRHPWTGAIACEHPRRGIWGGPPSGVAVAGGTGPQAARGVAFAKRNVDLGVFVKGDVPELAGLPPLPPADAGTADAGGLPLPPSAPKGGCAGCGVSANDNGVQGLAPFAVLGLAILALRRRRR